MAKVKRTKEEVIAAWEGNRKRGRNRVADEKTVDSIRDDIVVVKFSSMKELAEAYGISLPTVSKIAKGEGCYPYAEREDLDEE